MEVRAALVAKDYNRTWELAGRIPKTNPEWLSAALLAGEAATRAGRTDDAVSLYRAIAERQLQIRELPLGLFYAAEADRDAARLAEAESLYRQFLGFAPNHTLSHERMAFLTTVSGRRWESVPHYSALLRSGTATVEELVLFADLDRPIEQRPYLEECERKSPGDRVVQLGLAAHAFWEGETREATTRLRDVVSTMPDAVAAQAMLGELLVTQSESEFLDWHRGLPPAAEDDPDIWYVRGLWARKVDRAQMAARCFWESVRRSPTNRRAMFQWGQVLRALDHAASEVVESRSRELILLTQELDAVLRTQSRRDEPFQRVATLLDRMGRHWEAGAWALTARERFPEAAWPKELLTRVATRLAPTLPLVADDQNLALRFDLSRYPDFEAAPSRSPIPAAVAERSTPTSIRFEDDADGPDFRYANGSDPATPGARQFEQSGGGVAVLDFDGDRWPDLFFPQGGVWPTGEPAPQSSATLTDRLFRNVAGQQAVDITAAAHLVDHGFSQGAAAGDFDNDGFPDLYVANIGRNQLLHNNGDGTFTDVTTEAGLTSDDWTTSVVIVDLNADGAPDLFDVNYLTGPGVFEIICAGKACSPSAFAGAPDRVWVSRGDGTFQLSPPDRPEVDGKGLGVVAFGLQDRRRPSLLIANDQVPNFLLRNRTPVHQFPVRMEEEGFVSGVAFNQDGLAMASMGVAADDADGDGRLDFYVTTFNDESSLLLMQDADGLFVDRAAAAGFRSTTWPFVGWGTQFLDADCDGWPDLVGVNGHVDDYRDENGEYHMRPQFFRNTGSGRFQELSAAEAGAFFAVKRLGRGLSRLDWNRDGKPDFAVSNMGDRASLVLNTSPETGHAIGVRLHATTTARDAIGSEVDVHAGDRKWRKQLVAGDGYMASNERILQFGVGPATEVGPLVVHWPSGATSTVQRLPADGTLDLIEQANGGVFRPITGEPQTVPVVLGRDE